MPHLIAIAFPATKGRRPGFRLRPVKKQGLFVIRLVFEQVNASKLGYTHRSDYSANWVSTSGGYTVL